MLLRRDDGGVLTIGQTSHAWISGQLARAWGNERFGAVHPWEEVCLAAEQHDIGMAVWDLEPSYNPATGLPHGFTEMPLDVHMPLWRAAARKLLRQSRYSALLCSMHGMRLYEMRDLERIPADEADTIRSFLVEQTAFQRTLIAALADDPATRACATPELIERNSDLIWTWDFISLALCLDWAPCTARAVPSAAGPLDVQLLPGEQPGQVRCEPWPFAAAPVRVHCDGQRLTGAYANENELRAALAEAPWETLTIELTDERSA